ncbi:hypothetical protein [Acidovorax sp. NCPPB 4044]|uniref:hypothetical protein n=1 Tax=Acidovorax sp. NCPPB 4044 TaxID=2940490 RepID=UPI002302FEFC|nr:hypothetical protein [Acidovorax sp. NCPPB 4044]MDA8523538.1 hypothetical protein [Acidovorax sp. NCPPB 4044]
MAAVSGNPKPLALEDFFEYRSRFDHLNINLGDGPSRQKYHDDWMFRYRRASGAWDDYDAAIWAVRCRQSLKLCFSATYFALASEQAREARVLASAYYLAYYSALHAMWAVIYLDPDQTLQKVAEITHSKIANVFHSVYASGAQRIIRYDARKLVENLRFMREYYSYRMPLNSPFRDHPELLKTHISLGGFVKQSIQLANLQSHLLSKAARRNKKGSACVPVERMGNFRQDFFLVNGKEHLEKAMWLLEPFDEIALSEFLSKGCDLLPHAVMFDHMFDCYMTITDIDKPDGDIIRRTKSLVYNALL